ncbi:hypothetical protein ACRAWG_39335 (plasmid) [Methylobacterium sp. P31]
MGQDVDAAREAFGTVPPAPQKRENKNLTPEAGGNGPHSPGSPDPDDGEGLESGGYDNRQPLRRPDNAKGGHGAG